MELYLIRDYFPMGTNGHLYHKQQLVCHTIELPWKNNQQQVSCIPEGKYEIRKRFSTRFKWHIVLLNVPNRSYILLHPYNNGLKEAKGCIAPVSAITGEGRGDSSRKAMELLKALVYPVLEKKEAVFLNIQHTAA